MESIFDFNPSHAELKAIGIDSLSMALRHGVTIKGPITKDNYKVSKEAAIFDIALLLEHRNEPEKAAEYWNRIPERHAEYLRGFDFSITLK